MTWGRDCMTEEEAKVTIAGLENELAYTNALLEKSQERVRELKLYQKLYEDIIKELVNANWR